MSKKALETCKKLATEAYEDAQYHAIQGYRKSQDIYNVYHAQMYTIEGVLDDLCTSDEKAEWSKLTDKQHKQIRKILKL